MPVKRRVAKGRRNHVVPDWATRLLAGERPAYGSDDSDAFAEWLFFEAAVPGLPPVTSPEGQRLWMESARCQ